MNVASDIDRSNLVQYVEKDTGKFLFHHGEGFLWETLPEGTRVVFPPPPLEGLPDVSAAIEEALENPLECDPLSAQLRPGMKVTLVYDDLSLSLPPMEKPDLRQQIMEILLRKFADAGIADIHFIAAIGLHRRMTPAELKGPVGPNVFNRFFPDRLYNHDSEDPDNLVWLGKTEAGEDVELNRRAVESDLVIYVNLCLTTMDGGHKSLHTGISSYRSVRHHHTPGVLAECRSLMDPPHSALHDSLHRMGRLMGQHLNVFHVETSLNSATFPRFLPFLEKQEATWSGGDKLFFHANRWLCAMSPPSLKRPVWQALRAPYQLTGIHAGRNEAVHAKTLENIYRQQLVLVEGQSDILIAGTPYLGPYNVNSIMNPILVHNLMMGYAFNMYRNRPLVRKGGVFIFSYPVDRAFHAGHHPSYIELFDRVFPETTDPVEIAEKYEEEFATNPKYIDLYRNAYAFHGVHALYMWYWGCHAREHLGRVIVVQPRSQEAVRRMGYDPAPDLATAMEMAKDTVGPSPSITYYHWPPIFVCEVK